LVLKRAGTFAILVVGVLLLGYVVWEWLVLFEGFDLVL
jgi:hypothetical protein